MSLGGAGSSAVQQAAIRDSVNINIFYIVAAGNNGADASGTFPGAYPEVITIGATDVNDNKASWSNHGPLVDVNAPGVNTWAAGSIDSSWCDGQDVNNCYIAISGTSMACPVTAGLVARHFSSMGNVAYNQQTQEGIRAWLAAEATQGAISWFRPAQNTTPNLLVFLSDC